FQTIPQLYSSDSGINLDLDLTKLYPVATEEQGECNDCWAYAATEHFQSVLIRQGYLAGPWPSITAPIPPTIDPTRPLYHRLSVQQMIDCSSPTSCDGGSVVAAWEFLQSSASSGLVQQEFYPAPQGT